MAKTHTLKMRQGFAFCTKRTNNRR